MVKRLLLQVVVQAQENINNNHLILYEWSTSIFIRKDKSWICVHTMLTPAIRADNQ